LCLVALTVMTEYGFGDLISHQNDGKGCTAIVWQCQENMIEYSSLRIDMRADEVLISAEELDLMARRVGNTREATLWSPR
jgi:hypothetical protein